MLRIHSIQDQVTDIPRFESRIQGQNLGYLCEIPLSTLNDSGKTDNLLCLTGFEMEDSTPPLIERSIFSLVSLIMFIKCRSSKILYRIRPKVIKQLSSKNLFI